MIGYFYTEVSSDIICERGNRVAFSVSNWTGFHQFLTVKTGIVQFAIIGGVLGCVSCVIQKWSNGHFLTPVGQNRLRDAFLKLNWGQLRIIFTVITPKIKIYQVVQRSKVDWGQVFDRQMTGWFQNLPLFHIGGRRVEDDPHRIHRRQTHHLACWIYLSKISGYLRSYRGQKCHKGQILDKI